MSGELIRFIKILDVSVETRNLSVRMAMDSTSPSQLEYARNLTSKIQDSNLAAGYCSSDVPDTEIHPHKADLQSPSTYICHEWLEL